MNSSHGSRGEGAHGQVVFNRQMPLLGLIGGLALALGLPTLVLIFGKHLGTGAQLTVIILAIIFGAVLAIVSAVVGSVIPRKAVGRAGEWDGTVDGETGDDD